MLLRGVPDRNRTYGVSLRRRTLYPTEVLGHMKTAYLSYAIYPVLSSECSEISVRKIKKIILKI